MSIIYFLIILSLLVIVHELGHFSVAKFFDIRVDEFGLGYPPLAKKLFTWKETLFTLNWLPFGGFVKIFGENPDEEESIVDPRAFSSKNRGIQSAVLVAGVIGNFLFAWFLISIGFMNGLPSPAGVSIPIKDAHTVITTVVQDSPADVAGLKSGDSIIKLSRGQSVGNLTPDEAASFIASSPLPLDIIVQRGDVLLNKTIIPSDKIVEGKPAIGISMDTVGIAKLSFFQSIKEGFSVTVRLTYLTAQSLFIFIKQAVTGQANFSEVTGPVGLVSMVGDVKALGFVYLLSFTALISINLSIVNLLPIPALDGGRLFFVMIEAIRRKPISPVVFNWANNIGFGLLLILMGIITFRDIVHLI